MSKEIKCKYCDKVYKKYGVWFTRHTFKLHREEPEVAAELKRQKFWVGRFIEEVKAQCRVQDMDKVKTMPSRPVKFFRYRGVPC